MKDTVWRALSIVEIALAVLVIVAIAAFGDCPTQIQTAAGGSVPMKCHWTFLACDLMASIAVVNGVLLCLAKSEEARRMMASSTFAILIAILLAVTIVMGVCTGDMSECKTTATVVIVICVIGAVIAIVQLFKPVKKDLPKQHL